MHFVGQWATIFFIYIIIKYELWLLILLAPFVVYPFAWSGHYLFEKNEPAAFKDPFKAKISDWMMFWDILRCKIKIW